MRVGVIAFLHESNTFASPPTTIQKFRENLLLTGPDIRAQLAGTHHEVGGFFEGIEAAGMTAVPIFAARATPSGTITSEAFEEICSGLVAALSDAGPLDGLLVAPHGATVSESAPDADGEWLSRVRQQVGPIPIIGTLDPHANLSPLMVRSTTALTAYRTNPHLDQRARGLEAADLIARTLRGEIHPVQAAAFPPLVINIERQLTSDPHWKIVQEKANEIRSRAGVLSCSVLLGFPYADVIEMGAAALVVTDGNDSLAQSCADELARLMWEQRDEFVGQLIGASEAIARALSLEGPICLLDMGDNVGGGSAADGTFLTQELLRCDVASISCIYDPAAVSQAEQLGIGQSARFSIGGKTDQLHGPSLEDTFQVVSLHSGQFTEPEARHGGIRDFDQGPTAVLKHRCGATILVNSRRTPPFSLGQLRSCGLDPAAFKLLVAKGVNAPVAAYREICPHFIRVNTPGSTTADVNLLPYQHRRRPLFPIEQFGTWKSPAPNELGIAESSRHRGA